MGYYASGCMLFYYRTQCGKVRLVMLSDEDFQFLLFESSDSRRALEIGTGTGKSTAAIAAGAARVYTIDRDDQYSYYGLKNVERYRMESEDFWKHDMYGQLCQFDFVFVDGSIGPGDCEEIVKRCSSGFKIIFHDYVPDDPLPNINKGGHNLGKFLKTIMPTHEFDVYYGVTHCAAVECKRESL